MEEGPFPTIRGRRRVTSRGSLHCPSNAKLSVRELKEFAARSQKFSQPFLTLPGMPWNLGPDPFSLGDLVSFPHLYRKAAPSDSPCPRALPGLTDLPTKVISLKHWTKFTAGHAQRLYLPPFVSSPLIP